MTIISDTAGRNPSEEMEWPSWSTKESEMQYLNQRYQRNISCKDELDKGQKWYGPNILGSYAILLFTALDLASITSPIHNQVLFLLWLHPFILSGVISPLISSSILGTYWPGEFLFQYPIILPFHTVHGVLKARILKWFAIPFSSGPHSVRSLHHDPPVLGGPTGMA